MLENQLKHLGFSKNETKVYLALFDLGKCRAGQIIESTGLHRNLVYTSLDELVVKGLVAKVLKNGVATFFVNSPELLLSMVEEQKNIAQEIVDTLNFSHLFPIKQSCFIIRFAIHIFYIF